MISTSFNRMRHLTKGSVRQLRRNGLVFHDSHLYSGDCPGQCRLCHLERLVWTICKPMPRREADPPLTNARNEMMQPHRL